MSQRKTESTAGIYNKFGSRPATSNMIVNKSGNPQHSLKKYLKQMNDFASGGGGISRENSRQNAHRGGGGG